MLDDLYLKFACDYRFWTDIPTIFLTNCLWPSEYSSSPWSFKLLTWRNDSVSDICFRDTRLPLASRQFTGWEQWLRLTDQAELPGRIGVLAGQLMDLKAELDVDRIGLPLHNSTQNIGRVIRALRHVDCFRLKSRKIWLHSSRPGSGLLRFLNKFQRLCCAHVSFHFNILVDFDK